MPEESTFQNNSVFFIEVDKIHPNPYQPRHEFDEDRLQDLAESIRMYGLLQPLTVSRKEVVKQDGGMTTEYELIAGERRLRASKLIGLREVPALIRAKEDDAKTKLELAIIENLQREDLNSIDRAKAFQRLADEFGFKHSEIAKKVGKSREYVSNTIRLLLLPEEIQQALTDKKISEGHTRPLLMLSDRPEEQNTLFKEIILRKMTVRDAEKISRKIATEKVRKHERVFNSEIVQLEQDAGNALGTRVHIQPKEKGGKIEVDYFSEDDLRSILTKMSAAVAGGALSELPSDVIDDGVDALAAATPLEMETNTPAEPRAPQFEAMTQSQPQVESQPQFESQTQPQAEIQVPVPPPIPGDGVNASPTIDNVENQLHDMGIDVEEPVAQQPLNEQLPPQNANNYAIADDIEIESAPQQQPAPNPIINTPGQNPTPELSDEDEVKPQDFTI